MQYGIDIINLIVNQNSEIKEIYLIEFPTVKILQDRFDLKNCDLKAIKEALKTRKKSNLPFWDSLLLTQFQNNFFSKKIIEEASLHNSIKKKTTITRKEIRKVQELVCDFSRNIGFNSMVLTKMNKRKHIPLLDFHIPVSKKNIHCVKAVLNELGYNGYLLQTNRSYHFYGNQLITNNEFVDFLSKALLFSPIIDKNWIAHQLIEKSATLRISSKEGKFPYLIEKVNFSQTSE